MWGFFIVTMVGILVAIVALLRRYCSNTVSLAVKLATAYAWLVSMSIVAVVPLDVWITLNKRPRGEIGVMWDVAYWSTQALTWLILPFFQYYADAGDFTIKGKCLTSLKENAVFYGAIGAVGLIGIAVLIFTGQVSIDNLAGFAMGLSNAFGLIATILLMGYGLVEIPRHLWKSNPETLLKWSAHRAGKFAEEVMRSTSELENVVTIIHANNQQMKRGDILRKYMDVLIGEAEKDSPIKPSDLAARHVDIEGLTADELEYGLDKKSLVQLRARLFAAIANYKGAKAQYEQVMMNAFELENVVKCRQLREYTPPTGSEIAWKRALWQYKCLVRPHVRQAWAVIFLALSVIIIWCEATIAFPVDLSPLSLGVHATARSEVGIQILALLPLAYICAACYAALFSITAFNYNKLIPKATIGSALMQNGTLMCRFAAPTCWNFYHIIRMTGTRQGQTTVFTDKMGSMDVPVVLKSHLNTYLPLLLVFMCGITALNLWDKIMGMCVSSKYKFTSDDVDDEYTEKGRLLIRKEQEATLKGYAVGEVLHSAYFDLEFPNLNLGPRSRLHRQKPKGFFGRLFGGNKTIPPSDPPSRVGSSTDVASTSNVRTASTAVLAASRWTCTAQPSVAPDMPSIDSNKSALLASRLDKSPTASTDVNSDPVTKSGLDGIFAELGKGTSVFTRGLARGRDEPVTQETDSLLGSRRRS